jgi:hypothetical protein
MLALKSVHKYMDAARRLVSELRTAERTPVRIRVELRWLNPRDGMDVTVNGTCTDISAHGMRVRCRDYIPAGTVVQIGAGPWKSTGVVRYWRPPEDDADVFVMGIYCLQSLCPPSQLC